MFTTLKALAEELPDPEPFSDLVESVDGVISLDSLTSSSFVVTSGFVTFFNFSELEVVVGELTFVSTGLSLSKSSSPLLFSRLSFSRLFSSDGSSTS